MPDTQKVVVGLLGLLFSSEPRIEPHRTFRYLYYLGSFDTNYIICKNVKISKNYPLFFKNPEFLEGKYRFFLNIEEYSVLCRVIFKID
jgi:hypothetical protein